MASISSIYSHFPSKSLGKVNDIFPISSLHPGTMKLWNLEEQSWYFSLSLQPFSPRLSHRKLSLNFFFHLVNLKKKKDKRITQTISFLSVWLKYAWLTLFIYFSSVKCVMSLLLDMRGELQKRKAFNPCPQGVASLMEGQKVRKNHNKQLFLWEFTLP